MSPMRATRLVLLLSLLAMAALLVLAGRLLPALPAGEGIYVSAAVTILLGGLMIGSYAHFLDLTRWEDLRPSTARVSRRALVTLLLLLLGGLALAWPLSRPEAPVTADAGWYLHLDAPDVGAQTGADENPSDIRVKFTSGGQ